MDLEFPVTYHQPLVEALTQAQILLIASSQVYACEDNVACLMFSDIR